MAAVKVAIHLSKSFARDENKNWDRGVTEGLVVVVVVEKAL